MNALVMLLLTTSAPAQYPAAQMPAAPLSSYDYGPNAWSQPENRPRFFGRIREYFRRRSQGPDQTNADPYSTNSNGWGNGWGGWNRSRSMNGNVIGPSDGSPILSEPLDSSVIRPVPAPSPQGSSPTRLMPSAEPPLAR